MDEFKDPKIMEEFDTHLFSITDDGMLKFGEEDERYQYDLIDLYNHFIFTKDYKRIQVLVKILNDVKEIAESTLDHIFVNYKEE